MTGRDDPPPIAEEDLNKGMINLMNAKKIPKDVDLTPAFEKGVPLLLSKPAKIYNAEDKNTKREIMTGEPT
jgi:carbamoylphosphate synthase large subunit